MAYFGEEVEFWSTEPSMNFLLPEYLSVMHLLFLFRFLLKLVKHF